MENTVAENFTHALCQKCGTANRIKLSEATQKDANCGKCGTRLLSKEVQEPPANKTEEPKPSSGLGFIQSFGIATLSLVAFRYGVEQIADPLYKKIFIYTAIGLVVFSKTVRSILIKAALLLVFACATYVLIANWKNISNKRISILEVAKQSINLASGYGPVKNLKNNFQSSPYLKYVSAVDVRDEHINTLSSQIISECSVKEFGCQARSIARYVADETKYVPDPTTGGDYVKSPLQTLEAMAGDCDDKTVLASSLLGTIGIKTVFVFEKRHVYPRACFEKEIPTKYLDSGRYSKYGDLYCYDLEPTAEGSGLGVRHDEFEIEAIIDVQTKRKIY